MKPDTNFALRIEFPEEEYFAIRSIIEELKIDCFEEGETITNSSGDLELINEYSLVTLRFNDLSELESAKPKFQNSRFKIILSSSEATPNYLDEWKKFANPIKITDSITICPSWIGNIELSAGHKKILLDAGYAFGSGSHETTILCARAIEDVVKTRKINSMLDVGSGSGILSLIARFSGIAEIDGIDIDSDAVIAARDNAQKNSCNNINFSTTPISEVAKQYDLVVANIISSVLTSLCEDISRCLKPDGVLILSGLLLEEFETISNKFRLKNVQRKSLGEWGVIISFL